MMKNIPTCCHKSPDEDVFKLMLSIRTFELSLLEMFDKGLIKGTTHTCYGQESTAVGVISALNKESDIVFSNHRGHGHFLSYCGEMERLYLEILGHPEGVCGGRGGSQHLCYRNYYSNGIQGGIVPVASGMAMAEKRAGKGNIVTVFLGDGTLGEGVVYESFNMVSLWKLPVLFVIDNNCIAQSTPSFLQISGEIRNRPKAFGIEVEEIDGNDVRKILNLTKKLTDDIRNSSSPRCLIINSVRLGPHSKGDDTRNKAELDELQKRDPLKEFEKIFSEDFIKITKEEVQFMVREIRDSVLQKAS